MPLVTAAFYMFSYVQSTYQFPPLDLLSRIPRKTILRTAGVNAYNRLRETVFSDVNLYLKVILHDFKAQQLNVSTEQ